MVKKICLSISLVLLLIGCDTKRRYLTMNKAPYNGDELRIDGYYYSNPRYENGPIRVAVFYPDGFCFFIGVEPKGTDTLSYIENEILLNDSYISKLKREPDHIGVFEVAYPDIVIEAWETKSIIFRWHGEIVDETTFLIKEAKSNRTNKVEQQNLTFRFVEFSPKPNSSNDFTRSLIILD